MLCIEEFEFFFSEGKVLALPKTLEGGTEGNTLEEAVKMAADWLKEYGLTLLARGEAFPSIAFGHEPSEGGRVIAVAVDVQLADVPAMTAHEAALKLGVSNARVAQLCKDGILNSWKIGSTRMVETASVEYRLATCPKAGRPKANKSIQHAGTGASA